MVYVSTSCLKGREGRFCKNVMDVVNKYVKLGITEIELGASHMPFDDFSQLRKVKKEHELDFIFHANFPSFGTGKLLNLASADEDYRKGCVNHILMAIEKLNYLEGNIFSMHPGDCCDLLFDGMKKINQSDFDSSLRRAIESLQIVVDKAKQYGIKIAVENMGLRNSEGVIISPDDFIAMRKEVDVGMLLDIGHLDTFLYSFPGDRKEMIKGFEPYVYEIHCHKAIKADEHMMPEKIQFDDFDKQTLKKAVLTLEANFCTEDMILQGKKLLEKIKNP